MFRKSRIEREYLSACEKVKLPDNNEVISESSKKKFYKRKLPYMLTACAVILFMICLNLNTSNDNIKKQGKNFSVIANAATDDKEVMIPGKEVKVGQCIDDNNAEFTNGFEIKGSDIYNITFGGVDGAIAYTDEKEENIKIGYDGKGFGGSYSGNGSYISSFGEDLHLSIINTKDQESYYIYWAPIKSYLSKNPSNIQKMKIEIMFNDGTIENKEISFYISGGNNIIAKLR